MYRKFFFYLKDKDICNLKYYIRFLYLINNLPTLN